MLFAFGLFFLGDICMIFAQPFNLSGGFMGSHIPFSQRFFSAPFSAVAYILSLPLMILQAPIYSIIQRYLGDAANERVLMSMFGTSLLSGLIYGSVNYYLTSLAAHMIRKTQNA